jgi:phage host-nuclease inhibitor protein Gam
MAKSAAAKKVKTEAVNLPVPQSRDEAAAALARLGALSRVVGRIEADMNDAVSKLKEAAEAKASPMRAEAKALLDGLQTWCSAHRDELTNGGRTKTADLGTGTVSWRHRPPKCSLREVEKVIERIQALKLDKFLRESVEVDKEAMLREPALARTIAGVTIASGGEDFIAEPLELALEAKP